VGHKFIKAPTFTYVPMLKIFKKYSLFEHTFLYLTFDLLNKNKVINKFDKSNINIL